MNMNMNNMNNNMGVGSNYGLGTNLGQKPNTYNQNKYNGK